MSAHLRNAWRQWLRTRNTLYEIHLGNRRYTYFVWKNHLSFQAFEN